jgi:hypothetical protein
MISALFWDITQRRVVILYRRFGTTYRSHLQGSLKMGRKVCFETSVQNYHSTLRNIAEERMIQENNAFMIFANCKVTNSKHNISVLYNVIDLKRIQKKSVYIACYCLFSFRASGCLLVHHWLDKSGVKFKTLKSCLLCEHWKVNTFVSTKSRR